MCRHLKRHLPQLPLQTHAPAPPLPNPTVTHIKFKAIKTARQCRSKAFQSRPVKFTRAQLGHAHLQHNKYKNKKGSRRDINYRKYDRDCQKCKYRFVSNESIDNCVEGKFRVVCRKTSTVEHFQPKYFLLHTFECCRVKSTHYILNNFYIQYLIASKFAKMIYAINTVVHT